MVESSFKIHVLLKDCVSLTSKKMRFIIAHLVGAVEVVLFI